MKHKIIILIFSILSMVASFSEARTPKKSWVEKLTPAQPLQEFPEVKADSGIITILPDNLRSTWDIPTDISGTTSTEFNDRSVCFRNLRRYGVSLETRLNGCPALANQVIWETASGERLSFTRWPREKINRINEIFDRIQFGSESLGVQCPVPQNGVNISWSGAQFFMTDAEAFDVFAAHVAHSLYLESTGTHPWSLLDIPANELSVLLDSSYYHSRIRIWFGGSAPILGRFRVGQDFMRPAREYPWFSLSCDPRWTYRYLRGDYNTGMPSVLGTNQADTLRKLTWWFYQNVVHGPLTDIIPRQEWIPEYIHLRDRLRNYDFSLSDRTMVSAVNMRTGCHIAAPLMMDFGRALNLPLLPVWTHQAVEPSEPYSLGMAQHMGVVFQWTQPSIKILHHMDDIYTYFRNFYPIDDMGNPITDDTRRSQLFTETTWLSPTTLSSFGFNVINGFPKILPEMEFMPGVSGSRLMVYQDNGNIAGYWEHFGGQLPVEVFDLERQYQLCSWPSYLKHFCEDTDPRFEPYQDRIQRQINAFSMWSSRLTRFHTGAEHYQKAWACIRAYGGCDAIRNEDLRFYRDFGRGILPSTTP